MRQRDRQTDRQTDRQRVREIEKEKEKEKERQIIVLILREAKTDDDTERQLVHTLAYAIVFIVSICCL